MTVQALNALLKNHTVVEDRSQLWKGDFYYILRSNEGNKVTFSLYDNSLGAATTVGYACIRQSYCIHEGGPGTPGTRGGNGGKAGLGGEGGYQGKVEIRSKSLSEKDEPLGKNDILIENLEGKDGRDGLPGVGGRGGLDGRRGFDNGRNEPSNRRCFYERGRLHIVECNEDVKDRVWCWQRKKYVRIEHKEIEPQTQQQNGLTGYNQHTERRQVKRYARKKNAIVTWQLRQEYAPVFTKEAGVSIEELIQRYSPIVSEKISRNVKEIIQSRKSFVSNSTPTILPAKSQSSFPKQDGATFLVIILAALIGSFLFSSWILILMLMLMLMLKLMPMLTFKCLNGNIPKETDYYTFLTCLLKSEASPTVANVIETIESNLKRNGLNVTEPEIRWLLRTLKNEDNQIDRLREVFAGSQTSWVRTYVLMQISDLLRLEEDKRKSLRKSLDSIMQAEFILTLSMQLDKYAPPCVSSSDRINAASEEGQEEEEEEEDRKKKPFCVTEADMIRVIDLMEDLHLAEGQLNELLEMDISQWKEHLSWLSAVFSLRRLPVTWEEDEKLIEAAFYLKELKKNRVKSFLEVCRKQPGGVSADLILQILRTMISKGWDVHDDFSPAFKGHFEISKRYADNKSRSTDEIVRIMKDDDLNSKIIKDQLSEIIHLRSENIKKTDRVKDWKEHHVKNFISNFKEGIPQDQEEQRRHLLQNLPVLMAVVDRAIRLKRNITIRHTQWVSILLFLLTENKGLLEQVSTGEGKTLIIVVLASIKSLYGNKVDIITSSHVLAKRDATENKDIYQLLQVTVGHNCSDETAERKKSYKENQVVYGEMGMFQRDLLLDRFYDKNIRG